MRGVLGWGPSASVCVCRHSLQTHTRGYCAQTFSGKKSNFFFGLFTVILGDLEGAGIFNPPLKLHPEAPYY